MKVLSRFSGDELKFLGDEVAKRAGVIPEFTRDKYFQAVKYVLSGIDKTVLKPEAQFVQTQQRLMRDKAKRQGLDFNLFNSVDVWAYNKWTQNWVGDAIDNFGTIKNPKCPVEFQKWFDVYAYNGGHPFEIYPYICMYVRKVEQGFCLELADFGSWGVEPSENLLRMFVAGRKAGVQVNIFNQDILLKKLQNYNWTNR